MNRQLEKIRGLGMAIIGHGKENALDHGQEIGIMS